MATFLLEHVKTGRASAIEAIDMRDAVGKVMPTMYLNSAARGAIVVVEIVNPELTRFMIDQREDRQWNLIPNREFLPT